MDATIERRCKRKAAPTPQFIVDRRGVKRSVVLNINEYEELLEDLECHRIIAVRENDKRISIAKVKQGLKKHGLL